MIIREKEMVEHHRILIKRFIDISYLFQNVDTILQLLVFIEKVKEFLVVDILIFKRIQGTCHKSLETFCQSLRFFFLKPLMMS